MHPFSNLPVWSGEGLKMAYKSAGIRRGRIFEEGIYFNG